MNKEKDYVLITGSSRGLGEQMAYKFAEHGYNIILHGRNLENLKKIQKIIIDKFNVDCIFYVFDIRNTSDIDNFINEKIPKTVMFVNNAGVYSSKPFFEHTNEEIDEIIKTNLTAQICLIKNEYNYFVKNNIKGNIVNINSVAGQMTNYNESIYSSSKFGFRGFSDSIKYESLKKGIKITDIYSGAINVGIAKNRKGHLIDAEEICRLISKLKDSDSFFVNSINIQRSSTE